MTVSTGGHRWMLPRRKTILPNGRNRCKVYYRVDRLERERKKMKKRKEISWTCEQLAFEVLGIGYDDDDDDGPSKLVFCHSVCYIPVIKLTGGRGQFATSLGRHFPHLQGVYCSVACIWPEGQRLTRLLQLLSFFFFFFFLFIFSGSLMMTSLALCLLMSMETWKQHICLYIDIYMYERWWYDLSRQSWLLHILVIYFLRLLDTYNYCITTSMCDVWEVWKQSQSFCFYLGSLKKTSISNIQSIGIYRFMYLYDIYIYI